jgi:hypothetical protein
MQRIERKLRDLVNQDTARANAAEATAQLRKRRHEQEEVDAYLQARPWTYTTTVRSDLRHRSPVDAHGSPTIAEAL